MGFYRLNETQDCIPCKFGFNSTDQYPFNCYLIHTNLNFESARTYCESLNSTLWTPKSLSERKIYSSDNFWVNSIISKVGEPFIWSDGSLVFGFSDNEPNNRGGNAYFLNENALEMGLKFELNDISKHRIRRTVCQQNKTYIYLKH